jgi:hypothetical protein
VACPFDDPLLSPSLSFFCQHPLFFSGMGLVWSRVSSFVNPLFGPDYLLSGEFNLICRH